MYGNGAISWPKRVFVLTNVLGFALPIPGREGLRVLARALRAPMPEGFRWDFGRIRMQTDCGTVGCAMGLAYTIWGDNAPPNHIDFADKFCVSPDTTKRLFIPECVGPYDQITPPMVADAIDRYLDTGKIWPEDLRPQ